MPTQAQTKIPNPIYAAAGAGDLAIERLRKLPEKVADLQERVAKAQDELPARFTVIGDRVTQKVAELPSIVAEFRQKMVDADTDRLRETARRNAGTFVANAQAAQERAAVIYSELVARGERVVAGNPPQRTDRIQAEVVPVGDEATVEANIEKIHEVAEAATKPLKRTTKATKATRAPKTV